MDIGTSSSKGTLVNLNGTLARRSTVNTLGPGMFEMDAETWWDEFVTITRELLDGADAEVVAVGLSRMDRACCSPTSGTSRCVRPSSTG